ncbi:MAG: signal peptide peptidase SppA [Flavobacteriales bacterium]|nr:signal peptide peptidase SppA [Flavobacteriales bacterium]
MKNFMKNIFSTTLGIFLFISLSIIGIIILGIISTKSSLSLNKVEENSVLEITLGHNIIEGTTEENYDLFAFESKENFYYKDILDAIKYAKTDTKIKGISLKLQHIQGGISQVREIRNAILDFKDSGKFVYAYHNNSTQKAYYLSTVADKIYLNPTAMTEFFGLVSETYFFKKFGDKYGINFNVIRHGKYKAAVEPFIADKLSEENKKQITELLTDIWGNISLDVSKSRKIQIDSLNSIVDELGSFIPEVALKDKLVDGLLQESEYDSIIKKQLGITDEKEEINTISLYDYFHSIKKKTTSNDKIAILYAGGEILNGEGEVGIYAKNFKKIIQEIKNDESIKALVLRINSPGGSANASDEILFELKELRKKKPIVTSFGDISASGGYYIAMESDSIFAHQTTITGSIGVLGMIPDFEELAKRNGITSEVVQTNDNAQFYSPVHGMSPKAKETMTKSIETTYNRFVSLVAKNRKKSFQKIDSLGQGRVWTGEQALKNGLIDKIGNLNSAIHSASLLANISDFSIETYPKPKDSFQKLMDQLTGNKNSVLDATIKKELGIENYELYNKIKSINNYKGVLMLSPIEVRL